MAEITATMVRDLREKTDAPMMECKRALAEAGGDPAKAEEILRIKLGNKASKAASRITAEGIVSAYVSADRSRGALVEVNCETDFVGRNEMFRAFSEEISKKLAADPNVNLEADREAAVGKIGENIKIARHARMDVSGNGMIAATFSRKVVG